MIDFEFLSDQNMNFPDSFNHSVNYEDMNLNVSIPVFSIHGNHDDVNGVGRLSSMDLLSSTGLINYFGKWRDLSEVEISPIVLQKHDTKLALYGLSHIHDARLARLFKDRKVKIRKPDISDDEIFNMMVLHQNRADRGRLNYLPENELPKFLDMVIWGHEHDCRIDPEQNKNQTFVVQPGSSVATSLCEGESIEKHIGILQIHKKQFKMSAVKLKTVRPFIFKTLNLDDFVDSLRLNEGNTRDKVTKFLSQTVAEMIEEAKKRLTGHRNQPKLPLIRLRVMYTNETLCINTTRFGQMYNDQIANPESVLMFSKNVRRIKQPVYKVDDEALNNAFDKKNQQDTVEDVIESYFNEIEDKNDRLELFALKSLSEVCRLLVSREDDVAASTILDKHYEKAKAFIKEKLPNEEDIEEAIAEFQATKSKEAYDEAVVVNSKNLSAARSTAASTAVSDDDEDGTGQSTTVTAARGRGRGRGARGATTTTRGRAKQPAADISAAFALDVKKTRGSSSKQLTLAQSTQRSAANKSKSTTMYVDLSSDSD
jgi:double-strand break repair protein MRE11